MAQFNNWCVSVDEPMGNHHRRVMTGQAASLAVGIQATAAIVSSHYASEEQVARALARLGKYAAAALIESKLPTTKQIRSGDLGEIYATEWIDAHSGGYHAPIKRLRWKDHRNMAMRGEDVIGILQDPQSERLQFLKTEAKSRAALTAQVLTEARAGLDKDGGLPSAHALHFISARLLNSAVCRSPTRSTTRCSSMASRRKVSGICFLHFQATPRTRCWPLPFRPIPAPSTNRASGSA